MDQENTSQTPTLANRLCDWIRRRKLEAPAVFFLEIHRPLMPLMWPAAVMCGPFIAPWIGPGYYDKIESLRDPGVLDRVLERLEKHETPQQAVLSEKGADQ
jgi:hypothetical protein